MEQISDWKVEFSPEVSPGERELIYNHFQGKNEPSLIVKKGHHRCVERISQTGVDIYAKTNYLHNLRARLRRLFRPSKSKMEFHALLGLKTIGLPSLIPLAWAENSQRFGESILFTRGIKGSITMEAYWQSFWGLANKKDKNKIARNWAKLIANMHGFGHFHPDPHPGNLLVLEDSLELLVIDIHQPARRRSPSLQNRMEDLAAWSMWANLRIGRLDLARFLKYYLQLAKLRGLKKWWIEISKLTTLKQQRFWVRHESNILQGSHRRFVKINSHGIVGQALGTFTSSAMEIATQLRLQGSFKDHLSTIKCSHSSIVYRTNWQGISYIIKIMPWKTTIISSLKRFFNLNPAKNQWFWSNALLLRLLPTPKSFAWFNDRMTRQSVIITQDLVEAKQIDHWLEMHRNNPLLIQGGVKVLAQTIRTLHQRGVYNRDMKAANIMIDQHGKIFWVDLGGMGHLNFQKDERKIKDIARLAGSFWQNRNLSNQDRLRFLKSYLPRNEWASKRYKATWNLIESHALLRISARKAKGRVLG